MVKRVTNIESDEVIDEKKILKDAEEREKERKAEEKKEKEEQKLEEKATLKESSRAESREPLKKRPAHGKKYRALIEQIEQGKEYSLEEAIDLAMRTSPVKFDATVEVHVKINSKEKNVRGMVTLPGGVAKEKKILAVSDKNIDEVIANVRAGKIDFDVLVADLKIMPKLAVLAKTLGPKGLMPSPKAGTAVADIDEALAELKGGKVEFRADKTNIVHLAIGKISFGADKIKLNYDALISHLPKRLDSIYLTTSMGPSVKVTKK